MKVPALFFFPLLACLAQTSTVSSPAGPDNVNSRYTVDKVEFDKHIETKISSSLRDEISSLVGNKFDAKKAAEFASRIGKEVRRKVSSAVEKSTEPEHVRVVFNSEKRSVAANGSLNRLNYHSQLGLTTAVQTTIEAFHTRVGAGFQTDSKQTIAREIGWSFVASRAVGERVRVTFDYIALRQKWNAATLATLESRPDVPGIYRERDSINTGIEITLHEGLTLSAGVGLNQLETQFPATRFEAANALNTTLRFHRRGQSDTSFSRQGLDAGYHLRVATKVLGSDFIYSRHVWNAGFIYGKDWGEINIQASTGQIFGRAPLFERFVAGDSSSLRGWNRFDIAPLGGNQSALATVQYRYSRAAVFYDTGGIWERGKSKQMRHSVGGRLLFSKKGESPYLAVAFPIRGGLLSPLVMLGMNF